MKTTQKTTARGTIPARAKRSLGKASATVQTAPAPAPAKGRAVSRAECAARAARSSPHAEALIVRAEARAVSRAEAHALAALPLYGCATREEWRTAIRTRAAQRAALARFGIAQRRALRHAGRSPLPLAESCAMLTTAGTLALRERAQRGTEWKEGRELSATRRTRRAPQVESVRAMLARLVPLASAQRALADTLAAWKAAHAAEADAETQRAALAAYGQQSARAPRVKISAKAREARAAQLTASERRALAACELARRKGRVVTLAARDLQRARACARRSRIATGRMLALLVVRKLTNEARAFWLPRVRLNTRRMRAEDRARERAANRAAASVAGQRARLQFLGSIALRATASGERIGRKVAREFAPASGTLALSLTSGAFSLDAREGTGVPVERQAREEMALAARAAFLAGGTWKDASRAAAREIHRALKEPTFGDSERAMLARDRTTARARDAWKGEDCEPNAQQPHAAEFLAESNAEAEQSALAVVFAKRREARAALRAYWLPKTTRSARHEHARDLVRLRAWGAQVIHGERTLADMSKAARRASKEAEAESRMARRFGKRVEAGMKIAARVESNRSRLADGGEEMTPALREARERRAAAEAVRAPLWTLATGREAQAADWRAEFRAGRIPYAARLLQSGSGKGAQRTEARAQQRTRDTARTAGAMRAPLAPHALATLATLGDR